MDRILVFHPESLTPEEAAKKLKDRFYYGVRQNIREGLRYYYEVLQVDYTTLLTKARTTEAEKSPSIAAHTVTMKSASTIEAGATNQTNELTKQMSELITIVKNQQVQNTKVETKATNGQEKYQGHSKGGRHLKGSDTNASGPFRNGAPPFQCYNCSGWGHRAFECPLPLNYQRGEDPKKRKGNKISPGEGSQYNSEQNKPKHKNKSEFKSLQQCYHNPDPIARLVGKRKKENESIVIVDGVEYLGLLILGLRCQP